MEGRHKCDDLLASYKVPKSTIPNSLKRPELLAKQACMSRK
jgi:hypothetical protein